MLFALLPGFLSADNVSQDKAHAIAEQFFAASRPAMNYASASQASSLRMVWDGEDMATRTVGEPAFYVFNNENGSGFVIVSGDDCTTSPILGYSFDQNFDAESMPENLRTWMMGIRSDINSGRMMRSASGEQTSRWAQYEYNDKQPIKLLETALWDQRAPFNSKLPMGYVTGCPATAISIIMRYHEWPEKGVGTIPESNDKIGAITLGHTYDWKNMPLNYIGATEEQNEQVGILMRDVGAMVRTQYGGGTAGANPEETLPQLLPIYMRYNKNTIKSLFKKNYSDSEWHSIMQKELDEERPVLYGGYSSGGGHQFVIDGYAADNYYHVNWGWSGVSNGYYLLTGMNPPEQGAGGSSSADGFTQKQDAIIGIQPDPENEGGGFYDLITYKPYYGDKPYGLMTAETEFEEGKEFKIDIKEFQNKGSRAFSGKLAIAHYSFDGTLKEVICKKVVDYVNYPIEINEFTEAYFTCTIKETIEPGDYICGVFKHINPSDWTPIRNGYLEKDNCTEKIILKEGGETPVPPTTYDVTVSVGKGGNVICGEQTVSNGTTTIKADAEKQIKINIVPEKGYQTAKVLFNGNNVIEEVIDNVYTTPAITANSTLSISFEEVSGIDGAENGSVAVTAENGMVSISGISAGTQITIYALDGAKVSTMRATSSAIKVSLAAGRTYIVRVDGKNFKVVL